MNRLKKILPLSEKSQVYGTVQNTNKSQYLFFLSVELSKAQNKRLFLNKRGNRSGMTRAFHGEAATILRPWGGFELTMGWELFTVMRGSGFNRLIYSGTGCCSLYVIKILQLKAVKRGIEVWQKTLVLTNMLHKIDVTEYLQVLLQLSSEQWMNVNVNNVLWNYECLEK